LQPGRNCAAQTAFYACFSGCVGTGKAQAVSGSHIFHKASTGYAENGGYFFWAKGTFSEAGMNAIFGAGGQEDVRFTSER